MEPIKFEWDENKNQINKKKHDILFDEAKTVFYDEYALCIDDPEHSEEKERFIPMSANESEPFWRNSARDILAGALLYFYRLGVSFIDAIISI